VYAACDDPPVPLRRTEQLLVAAAQGHLDDVKRLLGDGANPNQPDERHDRWTSLHFASQRGNAEVLDALVGGGACVAALTRRGRGCLHLAAQEGHLEAVRTLLAHGAGPDIQTPVGLSRARLSLWCFRSPKCLVPIGAHGMTEVAAVAAARHAVVGDPLARCSLRGPRQGRAAVAAERCSGTPRRPGWPQRMGSRPGRGRAGMPRRHQRARVQGAALSTAASVVSVWPPTNGHLLRPAVCGGGPAVRSWPGPSSDDRPLPEGERARTRSGAVAVSGGGQSQRQQPPPPPPPPPRLRLRQRRQRQRHRRHRACLAHEKQAPETTWQPFE
jgi:hypothetical protein